MLTMTINKRKMVKFSLEQAMKSQKTTYLTKVSTCADFRFLRYCISKTSTFMHYSTNKCLHFNYLTLTYRVSCVQKWIISFYAVLLWFDP